MVQLNLICAVIDKDDFVNTFTNCIYLLQYLREIWKEKRKNFISMSLIRVLYHLKNSRFIRLKILWSRDKIKQAEVWCFVYFRTVAKIHYDFSLEFSKRWKIAELRYWRRAPIPPVEEKIVTIKMFVIRCMTGAAITKTCSVIMRIIIMIVVFTANTCSK